jgi:hypothetical protein
MSVKSIFMITRKDDKTVEIKFDTLDDLDPVSEIDFVQNLIKLREKIEPDSDISKYFDELLLNEIEIPLAKLLVWYNKQLDKTPQS